MNTKKYKIHWPMVSWLVIIHALAILGLFYLNVTNILLVLIMYFITGCLGICIGYHRLLTHRSFKTSETLKRIFATCGTLALQGGPSKWISTHRMHHSSSDHDDDPHDSRRGFWYSHFGWLVTDSTSENLKNAYHKLCRDITADPYLRFLDMAWVQIALQTVLGMAILYFFGFGAMLAAIFIRLCCSYHCTWFVNSLCHKWGSVRYQTNTSAKNNWFVALVAWGEGWHNNHHASQKRAAAGVRWWEFDMSYCIILILSWFRLAWDLDKGQAS